MFEMFLRGPTMKLFRIVRLQIGIFHYETNLCGDVETNQCVSLYDPLVDHYLRIQRHSEDTCIFLAFVFWLPSALIDVPGSVL